MKMINRTLLILFLTPVFCHPQTQTIDSLSYELSKFGNAARYNKHAVNLLNEISSLQTHQTPRKALQTAEEALSAAVRIGYGKGECQALIHRSGAHVALHNRVQAIGDLEYALTLARKLQLPRQEAHALKLLGEFYGATGNYAQSKEMHYEALKIWRQLGEKDELPESYTAIASVERELGNYDDALAHYEKARAVIGDASDDAALASIQSSIADLAARKGDWDKAAEHSMTALGHYQKLGDLNKVLRMHSSLGLYCWRLNKRAQAKRHYTNAERIGKELGDEKSLLISYINAGRLLEAADMFEKAMEFYRRAASAAADAGEIETRIGSLVALARLSLQTGMPEAASRYSDSAFALSTKCHSNLYFADIAVVRALSGYAGGSFEPAYAAFMDYATIQDSLNRRERIEKLSELEVKYHLQLKERENALLLKNQELGEVEMLRQADELKLLTRDKQLHLLELSKREATIDLQLKKARMAKKELALLAQQRRVQEMELEQQRVLSALWASGGVALAIIAALAVYMYRQKKRSALEQTERATQLATANKKILDNQLELEEKSAKLRLALADLEQRNDLLQVLDREKNEFLAIAAHDLKNPIGLIHGLADLIKNSEYEHEFMDTSMDHILHATDRMLMLISNLLDINRIESGSVEVKREPIGLQSVVDDAIAMNVPRAEEKAIRLTSLVRLDTIKVMGDESSLQQVLDNFISNAIKFSPLGTNVIVSALLEQDTIRINITDEGPGITKEEQDMLFKKFSRLTPQPTGNEVSTGLGLYIVERLVTAMGGWVSCESQLGEGSTFSVCMPLAAGVVLEPLELVYS